MCPPGRLRSISIAARIIPTLVNGHTGLRHSAQCSCCNSRFRHRLQAYGPSPNSAVATVDSVNARRLTAAATVQSVIGHRLTALRPTQLLQLSILSTPAGLRLLQRSIPSTPSGLRLLQQSIPSSPAGCFRQSCKSRFQHRLQALHSVAAVDSVIVQRLSTELLQ